MRNNHGGVSNNHGGVRNNHGNVSNNRGVVPAMVDNLVSMYSRSGLDRETVLQPQK